jgi:hypothetical protein
MHQTSHPKTQEITVQLIREHYTSVAPGRAKLNKPGGQRLPKVFSTAEFFRLS